MEKLKNRLEKTPYLLIDLKTGKASLQKRTAMLKHVGSGTHIIMDAHGGFGGLKNLAKDQTEFSLTDIAKVAGVEYHAAHAWMREEVLTPSIREASGPGRGRNPVFSFADAVAAGIIGSLRRQGVQRDVLKQIAPLLNDEACQVKSKKQTAQKPTTSKRS